MASKYHIHTPQTNQWHREEETLDTDRHTIVRRQLQTFWFVGSPLSFKSQLF